MRELLWSQLLGAIRPKCARLGDFARHGAVVEQPTSCSRTANETQRRTLHASGNEGKPRVGDLQVLHAAGCRAFPVQSTSWSQRPIPNHQFQGRCLMMFVALPCHKITIAAVHRLKPPLNHFGLQSRLMLKAKGRQLPHKKSLTWAPRSMDMHGSGRFRQ